VDSFIARALYGVDGLQLNTRGAIGLRLRHARIRRAIGRACAHPHPDLQPT
jgi:hypothetical protein